ncbi:MAG: hypothetical protein ACYCPS_00285 [Candidatus Saccharimonadales bacterium]
MLSTSTKVELLIITIVLCALFVAAIILILEAILLVYKVKLVVKKAEGVIHNVETAADAIEHMSRASHSRFPILRLIQSIFNESSKK